MLALHRPAEFNKGHVPAFLAGEEPRGYVCVYPFVRSYEWYLLDDAERRAMLAEHGIMAREYPDVRANTVACFALNDYEWILAFEADELHRIVDLMRHLRGARARLHTRAELPFYLTGRRKPVSELIRRAAVARGPQSPGRLTTIASWVDRATTSTASVSGDGFSSRCGTCGGTQTKSPGPGLQPDDLAGLPGLWNANACMPDTT